MSDSSVGAGIGFALSFVVIAAAGAALWGCPQYNVYAQRLAGEAELAQAQYSKQVAVQTAQAKLDSADLLAKADVRRAEGVAAANKIIADGLGGPEGYLRWKYIETLGDIDQAGGKTIIYLPTEAGLPILEAGRRQ